MAIFGTFICKSCGTRFGSKLGDLVSRIELRCESCDAIEYVPRPPYDPTTRTIFDFLMPEDEVSDEERAADKIRKEEYLKNKAAYDVKFKAPQCKECQGQLLESLLPKCTSCGSRDTHYDRNSPGGHAD